MPRLAVGTVQRGADAELITWALLDVLERSGRRVQPFLARSFFARHGGRLGSEAPAYRHLDSWLMSRRTCREIFYHGGRLSDLAIVEGQYDAARSGDRTGGSLDQLCQWLLLPRLVVLDVSRLDWCAAPALRRADGVLLDRVTDAAQAYRVRTNLEALGAAPVLGYLEESLPLRAAAGKSPAGSPPPRGVRRALGDRLGRTLQLPRLLAMAGQWEFPPVAARLFRRPPAVRRPVVAVALDEAFSWYVPDTLDYLESRGARIRDFSPLCDDRLPPDADLVYLGWGRVEWFADALASNHCMKQALRNHVAAGGRIFAEGGGLAYLCRQLWLPGGKTAPMAGVLPAVARRCRGPCDVARPVEIPLAPGGWLGRPGRKLRGYLTPEWKLQPLGPLSSLSADPRHRADLVARRNAVGARLCVNFAAQPQLLHPLFAPSLAGRTADPRPD